MAIRNTHYRSVGGRSVSSLIPAAPSASSPGLRASCDPCASPARWRDGRREPTRPGPFNRSWSAARSRCFQRGAFLISNCPSSNPIVSTPALIASTLICTTKSRFRTSSGTSRNGRRTPAPAHPPRRAQLNRARCAGRAGAAAPPRGHNSPGMRVGHVEIELDGRRQRVFRQTSVAALGGSPVPCPPDSCPPDPPDPCLRPHSPAVIHRLRQQTGVEIKPDRGDVAGRRREPSSSPAPANLQVVHGDAEARAQLAGLLDRLQPGGGPPHSTPCTCPPACRRRRAPPTDRRGP